MSGLTEQADVYVERVLAAAPELGERQTAAITAAFTPTKGDIRD